MATSISAKAYDGYPTQTAMRVLVAFNVTYAGTYTTRWRLYQSNGTLIDGPVDGSNITLPDNGSYPYSNNLYKTFTGLTAGTSYYITVTLCNASTGVELSQNGSYIRATVNFTTKSAATLTLNYHDSDLEDIATGTSLTVYRNGLTTRSGWTFEGWATSTGTATVSTTYEKGATVSAGSSSTTVHLYAVYSKPSTIYCYYINGSTGVLNNNTRDKIQYRVNTSTSNYSTNYYNTITLPNFATENATITTSTPNREWSAIGWVQGTAAGTATYSGGQSVSTSSITGNLYAVYRNSCSITYNANGGSGSMGVDSGYAYYNAYGNYTTPSFNVDECSFTPPTGKQFAYWNQKADGTGTIYYPGDNQPTNYKVIFYAIWITGRPNNWSWTTNVSRGAAMNYTGSGTNIVVKPLTATEWLNFTQRIKDFYAYKGKTVDSDYWSRARNSVVSGSPMTAKQANAGRYLIMQLNPPIAVPEAISYDYVVPITAAFINGLKNSLNSIE